MDLDVTLEFLAVRAIPGVESFDDGRYTRALRAPGGPAVVALSPAARARCGVSVRLHDQRDLVAVVARVRRLLDLDADPESRSTTRSARTPGWPTGRASCRGCARRARWTDSRWRSAP